MRQLAALLTLLCLATAGKATWQIPDVLIHSGKEFPIYEELLGSYFNKYPERKPISEGPCSALWRGYIATFEISNGRINLKDVTSDNCFTAKPKPAFRTVVPDGKPLLIDWYTGLLLSPHGSNDGDPYSLEFLDSFERYSLFEIDAGTLRDEKHFSNADYQRFKKRQFKAFQKTAGYSEAVKK